jgi:hypothetical protein
MVGMKKLKQIKIPVREQALVRRIGRRLAHDGQILRAGKIAPPLGALYFAIDTKRHCLVAEIADHKELAKFASKLGVLRPWETVQE